MFRFVHLRRKIFLFINQHTITVSDDILSFNVFKFYSRLRYVFFFFFFFFFFYMVTLKDVLIRKRWKGVTANIGTYTKFILSFHLYFQKLFQFWWPNVQCIGVFFKIIQWSRKSVCVCVDHWPRKWQITVVVAVIQGEIYDNHSFLMYYFM